MKNIVRIYILLAIITSLNLVSNYMPSLKASEVDETEQINRDIPDSVRLKMLERVRLFYSYLQAESWGKVDEYLGDFYFTYGWRRLKYNNSQKQWIIKKCQENRMLSFKFDYFVCDSRNDGLPLEERYWIIVGTANYLEGQKVVPGKVGLIAYLNREEVFFAPIKVDGAGFTLINPEFNEG